MRSGQPGKGVEGRAVEAFPYVGPGTDRQQWRLPGLGFEAGKGGTAGSCAHAAAEHDRVLPGIAQGGGESF